MRIKKLWLNLFTLMWLSACARVPIKDKEACAVAGVIGAGANCAHTLTDQTREMDVVEFVSWLEPAEDRGPAVCMSSADFVQAKTELEQACTLLKDKCTPEVKEAISSVMERLESLREQSVKQFKEYMRK